jgi:hypothetical protein
MEFNSAPGHIFWSRIVFSEYCYSATTNISDPASAYVYVWLYVWCMCFTCIHICTHRAAGVTVTWGAATEPERLGLDCTVLTDRLQALNSATETVSVCMCMYLQLLEIKTLSMKCAYQCVLYVFKWNIQEFQVVLTSSMKHCNLPP